MPQISNIGGSLTSAVVLTLLAWGVRLLRATAQRSQGPSRKGSSAELGGTLPCFFAALTPAALRRLVRHCVRNCGMPWLRRAPAPQSCHLAKPVKPQTRLITAAWPHFLSNVQVFTC